jgi:flavin-binding protein dodecin
MSNHIYKKIELVGSSANSVEEAIQAAITTASQSLEHIDWFEVNEVRGDVKNGQIGHFQVSLKVGFRLND